jgi:ABC-type phosphate transport system substrate-binding protein
MRSVFVRVIVLAGALVAVLSAVGASSASAATCVNIHGSGSSLQKVAQESVWTPKWLVNECTTKTAVTYTATSSGTGKKQWGSGGKLEEPEGETPFPAFIGSDTAASTAQMESMSLAGEQTKHAQIVAVPVAQSAITQMISLPTGCEPAAGAVPHVSGAKLASEWEKDLITFATLTGVTGTACNVAPSLLVRSSGSGTTAGEKHYFETLTDSAEWLAVAKELPEAEGTKWPSEVNGKVGRCCEKGSQLVLAVFDTPGTIGYADLADSASAMSVAWSKHGPTSKEYWSGLAKVEAGEELVSPESTEGESNCKEAKYENQTSKSVKPGEDWSTAKQSNVNSLGVYPVCTLTFDLAWHKYETTPLEPLYSSKSVEVANTVRDYLHWIVGSISDSGQEVLALKELHYGKLPAEIKAAAEKGVTKSNIG